MRDAFALRQLLNLQQRGVHGLFQTEDTRNHAEIKNALNEEGLGLTASRRLSRDSTSRSSRLEIVSRSSTRLLSASGGVSKAGSGSGGGGGKDLDCNASKEALALFAFSIESAHRVTPSTVKTS